MSIIISRKKIISIYIAAAIILSQLHIPAFTQPVFADERISYINDEGEEEFVPSDKKVILTTESNWKDGRWYVAEGQVSINKRVTVKGDVSLILKDGAELNIPKGITIEDDKSLAIYGQEKSSGKLVISSDEIDVDANFAAIGGSNINIDAGSIEINGGEIIVKGGKNGAGIGGGYNKNKEGGGGDITITGGTVFATGGNNGAGIGGGNKGDGGTIEITGGRVFATGGGGGAGIGTGNRGDDCEISLEWTNATDSIYASSFKGDIEFNSLFWNETANTEAAKKNIKNGARLIPAAEVDIDEGEHGTVSMDGNVAALGSKVILTVIPDPHYFLEELSVTDDDDNDVDVSFSGTSAVFTMPASDAYVEA
ncbi:MAG: hypothetical protein IJS80_05660, partial [Lachnospiraceae bacterium]|nr:hypothetical protein [Lachnospiraceae bacterium]